MKQWITGAGTKITRIIGGRSNVFLISGKGVNILVDTGPGFMRKKLMRNLGRLMNGRMDFLVLTHTHFDHAANVSLIKSSYNPKIVVHASEARFLTSGDSPLPAGTNLLSSWMVRNFGEKVARFVKFPGVSPDLMIDGISDLSGCGVNVRIIPSPGHTTGSLSIIIDDELTLAGDALFGVFPRSCFPPFADDSGELIKSWALLLNTRSRLFLPSHGSERSRAMLERCHAKRKENLQKI